MVKRAKAITYVPQSRDEVVDAIRKLGERIRAVQAINAEKDNKAAQIAHEADAKTAPIIEEIDALKAGIQVFCEANRQALTENGKVKNYNFGTGKVWWRTNPPRCTITRTAIVLEELKRAGLFSFIRTKEDINKDAILASPDKIAGITGIKIVSNEEVFGIEPLELENSQTDKKS